MRYIHRNPFRADMVEKLDEYQWSSHRGYITRDKQWNWFYKDSGFKKRIKKMSAMVIKDQKETPSFDPQFNRGVGFKNFSCPPIKNVLQCMT